MKIYITGPGGSGKSTLAKKLGEHFNTPVIHLDELLWNADWTENENYGKLQKEAITKSDWIIEGPSCSIIKSMQNVDKIIILNYSPIGNIFRIIKRHLSANIFNKKRIGAVPSEKLHLDLLFKTYIWRKRQLPRILENISKLNLHSKTLILPSLKSAFEKVICDN